jgi:hypothetical protein
MENVRISKFVNGVKLGEYNDQAYFHNVNSFENTNGFKALGNATTLNCFNVKFQRCTANKNTQNGFDIQFYADPTLDNCIANENNDVGVYLSGSSTLRLDNPYINNLETDSNDSYGLWMNQVKWAKVSNIWSSSGRTALTFGTLIQNVYESNFNNINAYNCGSDGLYIDNVFDSNFNGIIAGDNPNAGINVNTATRTILDNIISHNPARYQTQKYGIIFGQFLTSVTLGKYFVNANSVSNIQNNAPVGNVKTVTLANI